MYILLSDLLYPYGEQPIPIANYAKAIEDRRDNPNVSRPYILDFLHDVGKREIIVHYRQLPFYNIA